MSSFALNAIIAVTWALLTGAFTLLNLAIGGLIGFVIVWLLQPLLGGKKNYFLKVWYWVKLIVLFHYELLISSFAVVWDVLTPQDRSRPAIIEVPLDVRSDMGIFLVTNLISLTPGTLSLDLTEDRKTLLVHAMFGDDPEALRRTIKTGMERWVMDALG